MGFSWEKGFKKLQGRRKGAIMSIPVIVIGGGGHARVLIDALLLQSVEIIGYTDPDERKAGTTIQSIPYLGDDNKVGAYSPSAIQLVNGIGSIGSTKPRQQIFESFKAKGYSFASVWHPSAIISKESAIEEGVQIMAGVIIQAGCRIGMNTLINTRVSLDHDCLIDAHVHIAPGAVLSGEVEVEEGVHIGTGAVLIQKVRISHHSIVGAGAVVIKDVSAQSKVFGVPAKEVKE
jgi:sugar O-acyltransferase (sialic acid O-acetyltransferase NeuD family)